jgi:ribosomal protein L11 methyltransferase
MKWTEIRINTTEEAYDAICEMLTSIGAGGVVIEDPNDIRRQIEAPNSLDYADQDFMESLGQDVIIKAYFDEQRNFSELLQLISEKLKFISQFLDVGKGFDGSSEVDDENWATAWKAYYKTFDISERIVIRPSWEEYAEQSGKIVIALDPGMAFGTGTHETTRMCAMLLDKYIKPESSVIDVGCGSGILSIIAAKLGANDVLAIDIDNVAVRVAKENSEVNGVNDKVLVQAGVLEDLTIRKADAVVANIIADVIIGISPTVPNYLKTDGLFITSGIIKERAQQVVDTCISNGFVLVDKLEMGEWVAMVYKCRSFS